MPDDELELTLVQDELDAPVVLGCLIGLAPEERVSMRRQPLGHLASQCSERAC